MKVLLVDDSEPMRRMLRTFLADLTSEIVECCDGSEVLEAYRKHQPDVVLMDLKMSGMDGLTATKQLRQSFSSAKVVMVSQCEDDEISAAARSAGTEVFVSKSDLGPLHHILVNLVGNK